MLEYSYTSPRTYPRFASGDTYTLLLTATGKLYGTGEGIAQQRWIPVSTPEPVTEVLARTYGAVLLSVTGKLYIMDNPGGKWELWESERKIVDVVLCGCGTVLCLTEDGEVFHHGRRVETPTLFHRLYCDTDKGVFAVDGYGNLYSRECGKDWVLTFPEPVARVFSGPDHTIIETLASGRWYTSPTSRYDHEKSTSWLLFIPPAPIASLCIGINVTFLVSDTGELYVRGQSGCGENGTYMTLNGWYCGHHEVTGVSTDGACTSFYWDKKGGVYACGYNSNRQLGFSSRNYCVKEWTRTTALTTTGTLREEYIVRTATLLNLASKDLLEQIVGSVGQDEKWEVEIDPEEGLSIYLERSMVLLPPSRPDYLPLVALFRAIGERGK